MKNEIINVTLGPDGTVEVAAEGFKGKGCEAATKFIEEALGMGDGDRKKLPEYYANETVKLTQKA